MQGGILPLKGQSQLVKGRPIHSYDCGKYLLCQLDHAQQRKSDTTLYFRHKFIFKNLMVKKLVTCYKGFSSFQLAALLPLFL